MFGGTQAERMVGYHGGHLDTKMVWTVVRMVDYVVQGTNFLEPKIVRRTMFIEVGETWEASRVPLLGGKTTSPDRQTDRLTGQYHSDHSAGSWLIKRAFCRSQITKLTIMTR